MGKTRIKAKGREGKRVDLRPFMRRAEGKEGVKAVGRRAGLGVRRRGTKRGHDRLQGGEKGRGVDRRGEEVGRRCYQAPHACPSVLRHCRSSLVHLCLSSWFAFVNFFSLCFASSSATTCCYRHSKGRTEGIARACPLNSKSHREMKFMTEV